MRIATASSQDATARDQFDRLTALVEEALAESVRVSCGSPS
jgi:hypothetical protein